MAGRRRADGRHAGSGSGAALAARHGLQLGAAAAALLVALAGAARAQDCAPAPEPVLGLAFDSRYAEGDASRSTIDPEAQDAADSALDPVDEFLRDLTEEANAGFKGDQAAAACALEQMGDWARADALSDMGTDTAALTLGSRLAGFSLALMQAAPTGGRDGDIAEIEGWLTRRYMEQTRFWEVDAPDGARQGNLRAWAALGAAALTARTDDAALRAWATWSAAYVLCSAAPDGSLPQEMRRGPRAFSYQLHALAPLAVTALLLDRQGVDLSQTCDGAIHRVAGFVLDDLSSGAQTEAITGEAQTLFDGTDTVQPFQLAWIEAYLQLPDVPRRSEFDAMAQPLRPLSYSKLGGDQTLLWSSPQ